MRFIRKPVTRASSWAQVRDKHTRRGAGARTGGEAATTRSAIAGFYGRRRSDMRLGFNATGKAADRRLTVNVLAGGAPTIGRKR